jgi:hypothetical protein
MALIRVIVRFYSAPFSFENINHLLGIFYGDQGVIASM